MEAAFKAAVATEHERQVPRQLGVGQTSRAWDIAKLVALENFDAGFDEDRDARRTLTEWEGEAFPSMLERIRASGYPLTDRQRAAVDKAIERLEVEVEAPDEEGGDLPGMRTRRR